MQKYELVLVMDPKMNEAERKELLSSFETTFKANILETDDMGLQNLQYDLSRVKGRNSAYFMSYCLELEPSQVEEVKKMFLYSNAIYSYSVFKMNTTSVFWSFDKLNKELTKIIDAWDVKRYGNRVSFYANNDNTKYLTWKAVVMLRKYLTRFGNIKPRAYTRNSVSKQKALRKEVIRARELGLLDYIK